HRELGLLVWDKCGMARDRAGLEEALERIPEIRNEFWTNVRIPGSASGLNSELEKAGRVADFIEFAEVLCHDALAREESCGGHFRTEHQFTEADQEVQDGTTQTGEAKRHDDHYQYVAAWEHTEPGQPPNLHKEELIFEEVKPSIRSYK
ncbi:fumarate reductase/succinate dehydrogenase flavoprotein subunit, partial [Akkermansiaceae bacterium]|nr:fumarate reductase/succinate dehydrogenase flavoprotein subunit [Akkermansiaceae bacterium]